MHFSWWRATILKSKQTLSNVIFNALSFSYSRFYAKFISVLIFEKKRIFIPPLIFVSREPTTLYQNISRASSLYVGLATLQIWLVYDAYTLRFILRKRCSKVLRASSQAFQLSVAFVLQAFQYNFCWYFDRVSSLSNFSQRSITFWMNLMRKNKFAVFSYLYLL